VSSISIYDTTLRDGMQGEGMSLSAAEKLRVAHVLDGLGFDLIEAGFPASNPKEAELFGLLRGRVLRARRDRRLRDDAPQGTAREADAGLRLLAECFAPVATIVGKTWGLHLEKVVRVDRDENLRMIEDSVAFLVRAGKRVIYDAEHFFDAFADDPAYALRCLRARAEAGAENVTLCDTNGARCPSQVADAVRAWSRLGRESPSASTATTTPSAASPTRWPPSPRARPGPGHAQRLRRALRQREPRLDRRQPPAQARPRVHPGRVDGRPHRGLARRRRAAQLRARPQPPYVGATPSPTRADARRRRHADPTTFEHSIPPRSATRASC
jgi:hypothetical protein